MYIFTGGYDIYDVMYLINKDFLLLLTFTEAKKDVKGRGKGILNMSVSSLFVVVGELRIIN